MSKSPRPILGRNLTSLTDTLVDLRPGLLGLLGLLVPELAVVHDAADRRVGHRSHLDEVELEASGHPQRFGDRFDPELITIRTDQADLTGPDAVVDAVLLTGVALRRVLWLLTPVQWVLSPCSACWWVLDAKSAERTDADDRGTPERRDRCAVGPGRTRIGRADRGGQVGVTPTSR